MGNKARGLGRGLSSLISDTSQTVFQPESVRDDGIQGISIASIQENPFQPRRVFQEEELNELVESIKSHGILQPVIVRIVDGNPQLVAGERRVRAAKRAGLSHIPAIVRSLSDQESMELALVENLQRKDLNAMEEAYAYERLMGLCEWTQEDIALRVGKSRPHVANYLRLLQLEEPIQTAISEQFLTVAHAKVLLTVSGERRIVLARRAIREGWTVKQLQAAVNKNDTTPEDRRPDVHMRTVEAQLRRTLGAKVVLRGDSNKGRIEIPYRSLDELERIIQILESENPVDNGFVV